MAAELKQIFIFLAIIFLIIFIAPAVLAQNSIFFNGENITAQIHTINQNGELLIKARDLAELLNAKLSWQPALKSLEMKSEGVNIKLMAASTYIQIGNNAIKTKSGLQLVDNQAYVPLAKTIEAFGYLLEYQQDNQELYIYQPETTIRDVSWQEDGNQLRIKMNEITPYRVLHSEDGRTITIEIDKARIDKEFSDNVSNNNYYLKVVNVPNRALLRLIIKSKNPIPFQLDGGVYETDDALILSFLPQLKRIYFNANNELNIQATGEIGDPEIEYLNDGQEMLVDIPSVVTGNYQLDLQDNPLVKSVKVIQKSLDPVVLRVKVQFSKGEVFQPLNNVNSNILSFRPGQRAQITNLDYHSGQLSFYASSALKPELFLLTKPPRLVINLFNTERGSGVRDQLKINDSKLKRVRTARFDDQTVRLVADLASLTNYELTEHKESGLFKYTISFKNQFKSITSQANQNYQYLNIDLTGKTDYEIKKFNYPHRLVIDFKNTYNNLDQLKLPEYYAPLVKDIRSSNYMLEGEEVTRLVFELSNYYSHKIESPPGSSQIKIALARKYFNEAEKIEPQIKDHLIVVDAGHGGFDPGAIGRNGLNEKSCNLAIALKVRNILKAKGHNVLLTRSKDNFLSLQKRVKFANKINAEIFVSIHANSFTNPSSGGVETHYNNANPASRLFAEKIHDKLGRSLGINDRGIKESNFYVIKYTKMPSVLVEVAFLSNPREEKLLGSSKFQQKAASLIVDGILDYLEEKEGR